MNKFIKISQSMYGILKKLTYEDRSKLLDTLLKYSFENVQPELDGTLQIIFDNVLKPKVGAPIGNKNAVKKEKMNKKQIKGKQGAKQKAEQKQIKITTKQKYAEFVTMTEEEYNKLLAEYGKEFTDRCIKTLDNYKGANGKKYKSDYRAILNWVVDRVKADMGMPKQNKLDMYELSKLYEKNIINAKGGEFND